MSPRKRFALSRRNALQLLACGAAASSAAPGSQYAPVPGTPAALQFPGDFGAHPAFQTEWWYVTGLVWIDAQTHYGFQLTFFRSQIASAQSSASKLAAKHLVFAHAALSDVQHKTLHSDQRMARWSGLPAGSNPADLAWARMGDTGLQLHDWSLSRQGSEGLHARAQGKDFALDLQLAPSQPVLLQGKNGLSRKGPSARHFSYYYSLPQLEVHGQIRVQGRQYRAATGSLAWLDHEWSNALLPPGAVGWDWIGINMLDGSALTAFQVRDQSGAALWDGGSFRAGKTLYTFARGEAVFQATHWWRSPRSQARYPVQWRVRTPADFYTVKAVFEAQELDSSGATGTIYWEGLCDVLDSSGRLVGRGYLEMTGYAAPLRL